MTQLISTNGRPLGAPAPLIGPGQVQVNLDIVKGPDGPMLVATFDHGGNQPEQRFIPLTVETARQLGVMLISCAALAEVERKQAEMARGATDVNDLLAQAQRNVGG